MKLNDTINIEMALINIETLFLDFEQLPQSSILYAILSELHNLSQKFRKYFQLKNINALINELMIVVSAAIEREIILEVQSIDLFLHIIDLISNSCNIKYNNISEISNITDEISKEYINNIKNITKSIPLSKKTRYIKNELLKEYNNVVKEISTSKDVKDAKDTVNKINNIIQDEKKYIRQKIELTDLSKLVLLFNETINIAKSSTISLTNKEKYDISNIASYIQKKTDNKIFEELDISEQHIDIIDDYITLLQKFSDVNEEITEPLNEVILEKSIQYNEIENLLNKILLLNKIFNYNEYIRENIKKIIQYIINIEDKLNSNVKNNKIFTHLLNIKHFINEFGEQINSKFISASVYTNSIYYQLSKMRCKPFSSFTFGLSDFTDTVAESINKNVNLQIIGDNLEVTADLWKIFNNFLPTIIRHIVLTNFINNTNNYINIEFISQYGIVELRISDNGKKNDVKTQSKILKDTFLMCKNAGGRIFLSSNSKGNRIRIRFHQENILGNYVILEINKQYYAILTEYYTVLDNNKIKDIDTISLYSVFDIKNKPKGAESDFIVINFSYNLFKLLVDRVVGIAMLVPQRLPGTLSNMEYLIGASQFGDKSVFFLDIEEIIKLQKK